MQPLTCVHMHNTSVWFQADDGIERLKLVWHGAQGPDRDAYNVLALLGHPKQSSNVLLSIMIPPSGQNVPTLL